MDRSLKIFLPILCLLFQQCTNQQNSTEVQFSIPHPETIVEMRMESKDYGKQTLYKKDARWWMNDSTKVRPDAIENILKILPGIKIKYYPPKSAWQYMVQAIQQEGVKVEFENSDHHVIKTLHIGGTTNDERGTFAMIEGSSQPYVIHTSGFDGNLGTRFKISNEEWRDRMIIDENDSEIESIEVNYEQNAIEGFKIDRTNENEYKVHDVNNRIIKSSLPLVKTYLQSICHLGSEGIENNFTNKSLVLASKPYATIKLKMKNKRLRVIFIYTMESVGEESLERMFVYDEHDFFLAQLRILQRLFRPIEYFKEK